MQIAGVILAGGKSRRFVSDKRFLHLKGKTLLEIACEKMKRNTSKTYLLVDKNFSSEIENVEILKDYEENKGPLMGIITALSEVNSPYVLCLPVDTPFVPEKLLSYIKEKKTFDVVIPFYKGYHPLIGLYSKNCLSSLRESFKKGETSLLRALLKSNLKILKIKNKILSRFGNPDDFLLNINTQEDYERAKKNAGQI